MGPREFVGFLSALWDSRGWETGIRERDEGVFMVAGDRPDGRRGLMLVVPDPDATISGQLLQKVVRLMDEKEVDVRVAATRGTFSDDARRIGEANGVHLLDPDELEQTVAAEEAYDLVAEFSGGTAGDSLVPSVGYSLPSISRPGGRVRLVAL
ncbi:MAG: restriction endonuclease, partial [Candidatus Nanohaloarchaea archaeon]